MKKTQMVVRPRVCEIEVLLAASDDLLNPPWYAIRYRCRPRPGDSQATTPGEWRYLREHWDAPPRIWLTRQRTADAVRLFRKTKQGFNQQVEIVKVEPVPPGMANVGSGSPR